MSTVVGIEELAIRFNTVDNQNRFQDKQTILPNVTLHVLLKSSVVCLFMSSNPKRNVSRDNSDVSNLVLQNCNTVTVLYLQHSTILP